MVLFTAHFSRSTESPWWLVRAGKLEHAERNVRRLAKVGENVDPKNTVAMMVHWILPGTVIRGADYYLRCEPTNTSLITCRA